MDRSVIVRKGGLTESHINHGPASEAAEALRISAKMKRQAQENDDHPPTVVMRQAYDVDEAVQARLPDLNKIRKGVQNERGTL